MILDLLTRLSMAKDLQWFKFSPLNWMTGRIRKEPEKVQIAFLELVCQYWKNGCKMTVDQGELEIGDRIKVLISKKIIKVDEGHIKITFLDEQMGSIEDTSELRRNAALSRWKQKQSKTMQVHASAMQNDADKIREDKTRQDEILNSWLSWGELIVSNSDQFWEQMGGRKISREEMKIFISVASRNNWKMNTQQEFRISLDGFKPNGHEPKEQKNKYKIQ